MNKELIKKYKAEFEHTLNDKEITFKFLDDNLGWRNPTILFPINYDKLNILIVKNDEYVEFRKALVEGKTIQVNNMFNDSWVDIQNAQFTGRPEFYRIKQEEQFKVGDWLFDLHYNKYYQIINILEDKVETATFRVWKSAINGVNYEIWKPKPSELVIMETDDYSTGFTVTPWEENAKFSPVPFTGELPK